MRKVLVYSSKYGTVKEVSKIIKDKCLDVDVYNIKEDTIDVSKYDSIIIGTNVIASSIDKQLKEFCSNPLLLNKELMLFVCGLNEDITPVLEQNFSPEIQNHISYKCSVGGKLNFPKMNFFEKGIIKMINKKENFINKIDTKKSYDLLKYDKIEALITKIKANN